MKALAGYALAVSKIDLQYREHLRVVVLKGILVDQVPLPENCSIFFNFAALSSEFQHVWSRPMRSVLGMAHSVETYVSRELRSSRGSSSVSSH